MPSIDDRPTSGNVGAPFSGGSNPGSATAAAAAERGGSVLPTVSLPTGGGAIRGIGEKFTFNPTNGTGSFAVPLAMSPGRSGFPAPLELTYDSGSGNSAFGWGFALSLPAITRRTDKGLPRYDDTHESDIFILAGAEDLVPELVDGERRPVERVLTDGTRWLVQRYRPRVEGTFARIERWLDPVSGISHWRTISKENVTTWFGRSTAARIADPLHPERIFSWLIEESHDDKGNLVAYGYKAEDLASVDRGDPFERHRVSSPTPPVNRYIKRIRYGNAAPFDRDRFHFELVFDYGDHDPARPIPIEDRIWPVRPDPFSSYRSGFEIRAYRRCARALMFHRFAELGAEPCLVRSTDLRYREDSRTGSFVEAITHRGYVRQPDGGSLRRDWPSIELDYSRPLIDETIHDFGEVSLENLPVGLARNYHWVDLYREGLPGILTQQGDGWFYKPNLGHATFGPAQLVADKPAIADLDGGRQQLIDLEGGGRSYLVQFQPPVSGYHPLHDDGHWGSFRAFAEMPLVDWSSPNLRFVDLTGDGRADILIADDHIYTWYPGKGTAGFGSAEAVYPALDEEHGARLVFADGTDSLYLADMSGDGLPDLVRIRNGEVCYWPNLGYGRFGAKCTMAASPQFDDPDLFHQARLRLADVDGSGTTDVIYLGRQHIEIYFNESGNRLSAPHQLTSIPPVDDQVEVTVVDLLGNSTACLVLSSPLPDQSRRAMRYVDLMSGRKPHLLTRISNNLGTETTLRYAPSTRFYVDDFRVGRPWITKLPFPVQIVDRVEVTDAIGRNRFVTRFAYHHGYYDELEREFRGFGLVEQWDTEEIAALDQRGALPQATNDVDRASHVPPTLTRTWFHTGVFVRRGEVSRQYAREYYQSGSIGLEAPLPDTLLPANLSVEEEREACRALRGQVLRQEVYADDGTSRAAIPYSVHESNYTIETIQQRHQNRHAVFFTHARETIDLTYERNPGHPRARHEVALAFDAFGNPLRSLTIGYGREPDATLTEEDQGKQARTLVRVADNRYTNAIDEADEYRTPLPMEIRSSELTGLPAAPGDRFGFAELADAVEHTTTLAYERAPTGGLQLRTVEHRRILYRRRDLTGPLPFGRVDALALTYETYRLAFTPGLVLDLYGDRVSDEMLRDLGRYVHVDGDDGWWIPSGTVFFSPRSDDDPQSELHHAERHFFLVQRVRDPFGQTSTMRYDRYDLMPEELRDAIGNLTTIGERDADGRLIESGNDYRVLLPRLIMDANRNRMAVAFDALGIVVGTAVMGKPEQGDGDSLDGFVADLPLETILEHLRDPFEHAEAILRGATTRLVHDMFAYERTKHEPQPQPPVVYTLARETHVSALAPGERSKLRHRFSYSDGFGRQIQVKLQAEPGPLVDGSEPLARRWAGSGWVIFNNKGKPVRRYEPFFSATHDFEFAVKTGVSPILIYDPLDRVIATLQPNHTYEKVVFDAWHEVTWDVNDTVLQDPADDPDVGGFVRRLPRDDYRPTWYERRVDGGLGAEERAAADKAAAHAATPTVMHLDTLGRPSVTIANNRVRRGEHLFSEYYATRADFDIEDNQRSIRDALGREVMRYGYDMLSTRLRRSSMDAGERYLLTDVAGRPIFAWNGRGHRLRTEYDALRRPLGVWLRDHHEQIERLIERTEYGEERPDAERRNLRGRVHRVSDDAGRLTNEAYDFKGNLIDQARQLAVEYRERIDWSRSAALEERRYHQRTSYDALNRPIAIVSPDESVVVPSYNEANLVESIRARLRGAIKPTVFVANIDYDAKGQRTLIEYGNGARTRRLYDRETLRLVRLRTTRHAGEADAANERSGGETLQDLTYTYDPIGNIIAIRDDAQQTLFFRGRRVDPSAHYTYDALYRLSETTGREHLGQIGDGGGPLAPGAFDAWQAGLPLPGDGKAMATYVERYQFDAVGNLLDVVHRGGDPSHPGWVRRYRYAEASLLEPEHHSNRLSRTEVGDDPPEAYRYDEHGNLVSMPHLQFLRWDYKDALQATSRQHAGQGRPQTTWYAYGSTGKRVRKVTDWQASTAEQPPRRKCERIYLGGFEIFREYAPNGDEITLERETLHVDDGDRRVALVETRVHGDDGGAQQRVRYQFVNHLGSATLELDETARIITYEEYYPFGGTSFRAVCADAEVPRKRYRYAGKEHDDESGFYYYGARYYAPWLGRWTSPDPALVGSATNSFAMPPASEQRRRAAQAPPQGDAASAGDGRNADDDPSGEGRPTIRAEELNVYVFALNNPLIYTDPDGLAPVVIGRVYVIRGQLNGQQVVYVGSSARELKQRLLQDGHKWEDLVRAEGTKVTTAEVKAEINIAASGSATERSAVNEALRSAEQKTLNRVAREAESEGVTVLNARQAATEENMALWAERHNVKLGRMGTFKGLSGGVRLGANGILIALDIFLMYRDAKISRYVMAPYVLEDEQGAFTLVEQDRGIFRSNYYFKRYQTGPLAGQEIKISSKEAGEWLEEAHALWGYVDVWGDFVPGLLRPELPIIDDPNMA